MIKINKPNKYHKGSGLAIGLIFGIILALAVDSNGLFVIGIAIGAALESTYIK